MKRFHVHVSVENLDESVRFYSTLFGSEPSVRRTDYAKWMLEDPRVNFAISTRDRKPGINHIGFQVDSEDELAAMRAQLDAADAKLVEQTGVSCCYARSNKHWVTDPSGIAWETFHSLGTVPVYGDDTREAPEEGACCIPIAATSEASSCCVPTPKVTAETKACCA